MFCWVLGTAFLAAPVLTLAADAKAKAPKPYPLDTCVVLDEKLGGMGEPFVFEYEGREIKLCCKGCQKNFNKDPKKYLAKIDDAARNVKTYTAKVCALSGEALPEDPPASIYKGEEYKFCCKDCKKRFEKDPAKYAAKRPKQ